MKKLSIVTVNYKVEKELLASLASIKKNIKNIRFEAIVVENDPSADISSKLKRFSFVRYIKAPRNLGFGGGNNLGAKYATGEYLFFLNPDTEIYSGSLKRLLDQFGKKVGIVAPLLIDKKKKPYKLQGTRKLTPLAAVFSLSIINKLWPKNPVASNYWLKGIDRKKTHEVEVVPGTAFIIPRKIFKKIGGFDENFFLYFEEMDLCNRVKKLGLKILMSPELNIVHLWGVSTKKGNNINQIFKNSRFYYFKKNYGLIVAAITTWILEFNLTILAFLVILTAGLYLRLDRISNLLIFIPDQAWFYISAQKIIEVGQIPLVGITSSQTWLHQGPLWTYLLAPALLISKSPVGGAFISTLFSLATIVVLYLISSEFLNKRTAIIVSLLFALSPLAVILSRMPYHTSPIPFFASLMLFSTLKWVSGKVGWFPVVIFCASMLYEFELASVVIWFVIPLIFIFGLAKKKGWAKGILNIKSLAISVFAFLLPLVPIIIYDFSNEFLQTLKYAHWVIVLKILKPLVSMQFGNTLNLGEMHSFLQMTFQRLVFLPSSIMASELFLGGVAVVLYRIIKERLKDQTLNIIFIFFLIPFAGLIFNGVASDAYMPLLFPVSLLLVAILFDTIIHYSKLLGITLLMILVFLNTYFLITNDYLSGKRKIYSPTLGEIKKELKTIPKNSKKLKLENYQYIKTNEIY